MTIKYSENKIFAVDTNDEHSIYIMGSEVENQLKTNKFIKKYMKEKRGKKLKDRTYKKYTTCITLRPSDDKKSHGLENDCLMLSEAITQQDFSTFNKNIAQLRVEDDDKKRLFGHSDKQNVSIAENIISKRNTKFFTSLSPTINHSYVIIKREVSKKDKDCPYHAAAVIFKDGDSTITLEADAGNKKLRKPVFDIYSPDEKNGLKSFYNTYKNDYTIKGKIPASSVLFPR